MRIISAIDKAIAYLENSLVVVIVTILVFMSFSQVILRNFFDAGLLWGDIFLRHLVLWVGFVGASLATRQEKHISIDALSRLLSEKSLPVVRMVVDIFSVGVCAVLARAGYIFVMYEYEAESVLFNDVPAWIFQIIIPVGFALIGFRFLLRSIERALGMRKAPPPIKLLELDDEPPLINGDEK